MPRPPSTRMRILLAAVGGVSFLPDEARSEALFSRLRAGPLCATLSRTVVDARRAGIFLRREARGLPLAAPAGGEVFWDGRRRITLDDSSGALLIAPLGQAAAAKRDTAENGTPPSLVARCSSRRAGAVAWRPNALVLRARAACRRPSLCPRRRALCPLPAVLRSGARRSRCRADRRAAGPSPAFPAATVPGDDGRKLNPDVLLCLARGGALPMLGSSFLS